MSTLASVVLRDVIANRPAAGVAGRLFFSTDTPAIYRDNGATWDVLGAAGYINALLTLTSAYTALATDNTILCDATSGAFTVSLPVAPIGTEYTVKKIDVSANAITVQVVGGTATIDGSTSPTLAAQFNSITVQSDGTNYFIIAKV